MLLIPCPFCGPRAEPEFRCAGESHIARPPLSCTDAEWANYLYMRQNPKGIHYERWLHLTCGLWFNVARSTVSHEIRAVYAIDAPKPEQA